MVNIFTTGGTGLVLSRFLELYGNKYKITDINKDRSKHFDSVKYLYGDILEKEKLNNIISKQHISFFIHAAAYTDVGKAELERTKEKDGLAWQVNINGTENILNALKLLNPNTHFIFISTDYVFDGKNGPYVENDQPATNSNNISWYGWTKLQGEKLVKESGLDYTIIRISFPYRKEFSQKLDFARKIISLYDTNCLYPLFDDQYLTPTFIDDFAKATSYIIDNNLKGTFHIVSRNLTTPYDFAKLLLEKYTGKKIEIKKTSIVEYLKDPTKTKIPIRGGLKIQKIESEGVAMRSILDGINQILD